MKNLNPNSAKSTKKRLLKSKKKQIANDKEAFQMGFDDCLIDCLTFLMEEENLNGSDKMMQQLVNFMLVKRSMQFDKQEKSIEQL